jgi:MFS family permease
MAIGASDANQVERSSFIQNVRRFYLFAFFFNFQPWVPIWVLYLIEERGLTLAQVAAMEAVFQGVIVLAEMPTGAIADRWGRKTSMLLGGIGAPLGIVFFGLADSFGMLLLSYTVWAFSFTLFSGADSAFVYDSLASVKREGEFSRVMGRGRALAMGAAMVGALIGAPMAAVMGLTTPIFVGAAMSVLATVVVLTFREPPRHEEHVELKYCQIICEALRYARSHAQVRTMMALHAVLAIAALSGFIMIQPYLSAHDVPTAQFGIFVVAAHGAAALGSLSAHRLAGRLGEGATFGLVTGALGGGFLVLAGLDSLVVFPAFALIYFANSAFVPLSNGYVSRHSPQHLRATLISVTSMGASLAVVVSQPAIGYTADATSLQGAFALVGLVVLVLGSLAMMAWLSAFKEGGEESLAFAAPASAE